MRALVVVLTSASLVSACDPCAGTPSCHMQPEISYTGQFIEFPSGRTVAGVDVAFAHVRGTLLTTDTVRATSSSDGFFVLRSGALGEGEAEGNLIVTPPAPHNPYTVRRLRLATHTKRGDGGFLGRLMVNPYLQFIGELHDLKTSAVVPEATITIRQFGPGVLEPQVTQVTSAENGRFMWEPSVIEFGDVAVEFEVTATGYPRSYFLRDTISLEYRDAPPRLVALQVGGGLSYYGVLLRRGTYQPIPGVSVEFARTGGILATPDTLIATPDPGGTFPFAMEPVGEGTLIGDLTIRPPDGLPTETVRDIELETFDGGKTRLIGFFYGPATILRPVFVYRENGQPVKEGTHVRFARVGGLAITPAPWGIPVDSGIRIVDSAGVAGYDAATQDTGTVLYDMEVRLNAPHAWDTVRAVPIPARRSDTPVADTFRVGRSVGVINQTKGVP